jgi:CRP-like cAMP-binding protein
MRHLNAGSLAQTKGSPLHDRVASPLAGYIERFTTLSPAERAAIRAIPLRSENLPALSDVFQMSRRPNCCILIEEGMLISSITSSSGRRQIISLSITGDIPDLLGLLVPASDVIISTAAAKASFFRIMHADIRRLIGDHPRLAGALWRSTISTRLIERAWLFRNGQLSSERRLAHLFCEHLSRARARGQAQGEGCALPLRQADLADALGLSVVHVNRGLQSLRQSELLSFEKGYLQVLNLPRLAAIAAFDGGYLAEDVMQGRIENWRTATSVNSINV